jgi:hypothetical protein
MFLKSQFLQGLGGLAQCWHREDVQYPFVVWISKSE